MLLWVLLFFLAPVSSQQWIVIDPGICVPQLCKYTNYVSETAELNIAAFVTGGLFFVFSFVYLVSSSCFARCREPSHCAQCATKSPGCKVAFLMIPVGIILAALILFIYGHQHLHIQDAFAKGKAACDFNFLRVASSTATRYPLRMFIHLIFTYLASEYLLCPHNLPGSCSHETRFFFTR